MMVTSNGSMRGIVITIVIIAITTTKHSQSTVWRLYPVIAINKVAVMMRER